MKTILTRYHGLNVNNNNDDTESTSVFHVGNFEFVGACV